MSIDTRWVIPLLLICAAPAHADGFPDGTLPDPGRNRSVTQATPTWGPDGKRIAGPVAVGQPRPGAPIAIGGGPWRVDGEGTRWNQQSRRLGFLPVPIYVAGATNYRRSGGGLVRVLNSDLDGPLPVGPIAAAAASMPSGGGQPPGRPPSAQVPGPVPFLGLGAAWMWSRRLRRRIHRKTPNLYNLYTP